MTRTVAFVLLLPIFLVSQAWAAQENVVAVSGEQKQLFGQLIGKETEARDAAYALLEKSGSGALVPALEAYRNGLLERRPDGRLVIYLSRIEVDGRTLFPIVDAWTQEALEQSDGSPLYAEGLSSGMLKSDSSEADSLNRLAEY